MQPCSLKSFFYTTTKFSQFLSHTVRRNLTQTRYQTSDDSLRRTRTRRTEFFVPKATCTGFTSQISAKVLIFIHNFYNCDLRTSNIFACNCVNQTACESFEYEYFRTLPKPKVNVNGDVFRKTEFLSKIKRMNDSPMTVST